MSTACSQLDHGLFPAGSQRVCCWLLSTACLQLDHGLFTAGLDSVSAVGCCPHLVHSWTTTYRPFGRGLVWHNSLKKLFSTRKYSMSRVAWGPLLRVWRECLPACLSKEIIETCRGEEITRAVVSRGPAYLPIRILASLGLFLYQTFAPL